MNILRLPARRSRVPSGLLCLALLPLLSACASLFAMPKVEIVGVELASLGLDSGTAEVTLEVTNERNRAMNLRGFLYELEVRGSDEGGEWLKLADGFHARHLALSGGESREVVVPVTFEYRSLGGALRSLLSRGEVPYRISGELWLGSETSGLHVPFRSDGVLRP